MLKGFLYRCRIIRAFGWPIPFAMAAIGILGAYIGGANNVGAQVGIMLITIFTPFLTFALSSSSGSLNSQMLVNSLPMTKNELLKGRYLFIYFALSVSAFLSLGIVKLALLYDRLALGGSFNQNLLEIFIIFWCGMVLIHSFLLPFILFSFNLSRFMLFMCSQVLLMIFVASNLVYSALDPLYLLILIVSAVISIPLSYKLSAKNDPEMWRNNEKLL